MADFSVLLSECNKQMAQQAKDIDDLREDVKMLKAAYYGNGDGQLGVRGNVQILLRSVEEIRSGQAALSADMGTLKQVIFKGQIKQETRDEDAASKAKKEESWIKRYSFGIAAIAVIISLLGLIISAILLFARLHIVWGTISPPKINSTLSASPAVAYKQMPVRDATAQAIHF